MRSFEALNVYLKPIMVLLSKDGVNEISINEPNEAWVEKRGDMFKVNLKFVTRILLYFFEQHKIYYYGLCLNIITILNKTTNLVFGDIVEDQLMVEFYKAFKHTSFAKLIEDYKDIKYNLKLKLIGNYKNA